MIVSVTALALAYALGVTRVRAWPRARIGAFAGGLAVLLVVQESPLHAWADRLASAHMSEHMLICLIAAPLLAAGAPLTLALRALHGGARQTLAAALRLAGAVANPVVGCLALSAALLALHLTPLAEKVETDPILHDAAHIVLLAAALLFWAPLLGALPGREPGSATRIAALLALMAPMGAIGAVLMTTGGAGDRAAGVIMWLGGGIALSLALVAVAAHALWQEEQRMRRREAVRAR